MRASEGSNGAGPGRAARASRSRVEEGRREDGFCFFVVPVSQWQHRTRIRRNFTIQAETIDWALARSIMTGDERPRHQAMVRVKELSEVCGGAARLLFDEGGSEDDLKG